MIQIQKLRIVEFRGIRELELNMTNASFVVFGPNGSGKSGVVDAIDFALTGSIARLSGAGTGGVSVAKHAPHVHKRDNPAAAKVSLTFTHSASGQVGVLTRCVKTANQFTLEPNTPELADAVAWAAGHPELILSRREIIKYVNAEPGKRAQEVQALLKLDRIDETRRLLNTARNKTSASLNSADDAVKTAEDGVKRILDVASLLPIAIMASVNKRRTTLGLDPLTTVDLDTDLSTGAMVDSQRSSFNKASAASDVHAFLGHVSSHKDLDDAGRELIVAVRDLEADPSVLDALKHRQLVEMGLPLVTDELCPLCDSAWPDADSLRQHLAEKLARSEAAATIQLHIRDAAEKVAACLRTTRGLIQAIQPHAVVLGQTELQNLFLEWTGDLAALESRLTSIESIRREVGRLETDILATPPSLSNQVEALDAAIRAQPDQTATEAAQTFLTVAQDRWLQVRHMRARAATAAKAHKSALAVYETYNEVADSALAALYKTVESDFSSYYRHINSDDESSFTAGLLPSAGKLDLEVDFYGLGKFPPAAYHSEGHQDGMGVCLYLALIRQLLKTEFRFAVLDDVVTSVDTNHRRQFCKLLKDRFPDVQFIITTHDEVWARQMQSEGLVSRSSLARFHGWTVDGGPLYGQGGDVWAQIQADLDRDDVPGAAHKLRRNLEASLSDIAGTIQGQVVFRADNNYDLSAFFAAVKGRHGDLLKKAAASANSWNNEPAKQVVEALKQQRAEAILAQDDENWAINALVHNNDWATMSKADFEPVVDACRRFLALFVCSNADCEGWIYVLGHPGKEEELRCSCGSFLLNLRKK